MCKHCRRTFNDLTGTPFSGTHYQEKWAQFINCMINGLTLNETADQISLSYVTAFYWRHKILQALKNRKPKEMIGVVELENIYMKYSRKGQKNCQKLKREHSKTMTPFSMGEKKVCVLFTSDRFRNVYATDVLSNKLSCDDLQKITDSFISNENTISTFRNIPFGQFISVKNLNTCDPDLRSIAVVMEYINKLMKWLARFRGVATKYLNNYLSWYKAVNDINFIISKDTIKRILEFISLYKVNETYLSIRTYNIGN